MSSASVSGALSIATSSMMATSTAKLDLGQRDSDYIRICKHLLRVQNSYPIKKIGMNNNYM